MTVLRLITYSAAASIVLSSLVSGQDHEKKIQRSELPPAVEKTVVEQSRGATIRGFSREKEKSDEMRQGSVLYFAEVDNLSGRALNRMQILEATPSRLVLAVENVSTIRYHLLPLFHSGELQSLYFLDHESGDIWRYYSITRTGKHVNRLVEGNESSLTNRAVAFYRHFVGIPSTQEPPVAR